MRSRRLTVWGDFVPVRAVKFALPLLALSVLSLAACTTDANRRDTYKPAKGDGPYTRMLEDGSWEDRGLAVGETAEHRELWAKKRRNYSEERMSYRERNSRLWAN